MNYKRAIVIDQSSMFVARDTDADNSGVSVAVPVANDSLDDTSA
jgi:hypothetical protein